MRHPVLEVETGGAVHRDHRNREIAQHLYLSEKTVKAHLAAIFRKLGVTNRTQAAWWPCRWASARCPARSGELRLDAWGGWGSVDLPPHRTFTLGGRGTLVGEPFRAYGGRQALLARLAWALPLPAPAIPLGRYASTGRQLVVAPFVGVGWTGAPVPELPWGASDGGRPVLGVTVEAFHRLLLFEVGWAVRQDAVGFTVDARRDLWPIL